MEKRDDPSNPSGAYVRMSGAWEMINDVLEGPAAVRAKKTRYLPKFESEDQAEYDRRASQAPWEPEFEDILGNLTAKPFAKDVALIEGASPRIEELIEDIDGRGNNLTAFARPVFRGGVAFGCHAILVDNTGMGAARTVAEERASNVRPYWVAINARDIIDLKTAFVEGREQPYHVRVKETAIRRDGYEEIAVERVREFNREPQIGPKQSIVSLGPPTWRLHEAKTDADNKRTWEVVDQGEFKPLTEIPLVLFWTGDRQGPQYVQPPLCALADKQIELYRAMSRKDEAFTKAGFPMLTANGLGPPAAGAKIEVGPGRILYAAAPQASWDYIQPAAENLRELREDIAQTRDDLRRLGKQPLLPRSGGQTATGEAISGANAHSSVQAWALGLKDALEQALAFTSKWLGEEPNAEVAVHIDFLAGTMSQPGLDALHKARSTKEISRRSYIEGLIRFGVLPGDFDIDADEELVAEEMAGLEPETPPGDPNEQDPPQQAA